MGGSSKLEANSKNLDLRRLQFVVEAGQGDSELRGGLFLPLQAGAVLFQQAADLPLFKGAGPLGQGKEGADWGSWGRLSGSDSSVMMPEEER